MSKPVVNFCHCGTEEAWQKHREDYHEMNCVIPGTIYVSKNGLCLVTSQEWVDWLMGRTEKIPDTKG